MQKRDFLSSLIDLQKINPAELVDEKISMTYLHNYVNVLIQMKNYDSAISMLENAISQSLVYSKSTSILNKIAYLYKQQGNKHLALEYYKMSLKINSKNLDALINSSNLTQDLGFSKSAHKIALKVKEFHHKYPDLTQPVVKTYFFQHDIKEAISEAKEMCSLNNYNTIHDLACNF